MQSSTQNPGEVQVWQLDMDKYDSVKAFATRLQELPKVDALLVNAGISTKDFVQAEGSESILVINVISSFLLAYLALPVLKRTAAITKTPSRLVFSGSVVHTFADPRELIQAPPTKVFANLGDREQANMNTRYFLSKLIVMMGVRRMVEDINPKEVIVNCPNPGWCKTPLFKTDDGGAAGRFMLRLMGRTAEIGARCFTSAAVAGPETHGQYLSECQVKRVSSWLRTQEGTEVEAKVYTDLMRVLKDISDDHVPGQGKQ